MVRTREVGSWASVDASMARLLIPCINPHISIMMAGETYAGGRLKAGTRTPTGVAGAHEAVLVVGVVVVGGSAVRVRPLRVLLIDRAWYPCCDSSPCNIQVSPVLSTGRG